MDVTSPFRAYMVRRSETGEIGAAIESVSLDQLPPGDVLIEVEWSSLNYKDALAARGHAGVVRRLPHVPGIDAAGHGVDPGPSGLDAGQKVIVTGFELGAGQWGGWSRYISVPAAWIVPLPTGMELRESMIYGTAGFTAVQCVQQLQRHDIVPKGGPIVVTGATGGVGCLAVRLLSQLGYQVVASTGKNDSAEWLRRLGASEVIPRTELESRPDRPLASARWAGGIDTVGGTTLAHLLATTQLHGCITACGLVGGSDLATTVYPFILRGVSLVGITSQNCPDRQRHQIWELLAGSWRLSNLDTLTREAEFAQLEGYVDQILQGALRGRVVVHVREHVTGAHRD
jgi:putative YhdH/YhfP family quinone oxidoreductase